MSESVYKKLDIACEYLDMAMQLYLEKINYFCIIHLAGAAEELFGKHLPTECKPIHELAIHAQKALKILETRHVPESKKAHKKARKEAELQYTNVRNSIKHMTADKTTITLYRDVALEAEYAIENALSNFYNLNLKKSPVLWRYEDHINERMHLEIGRLQK
jgi:hypothetical protein